MAATYLEKEYPIYVSMIAGATLFFQWQYHVVSVKVYKSLIPQEYSEMTIARKSRARGGIVSSTNAVIMFSFSLYLLLRHNLHDDICWKDDFYVRLLACVEIGNYLSDSLVLLNNPFEKDTVSFLFHHIAIILGSYIVIVYQVLAFFFCLRGMNELSVPFQHIREVMYDIKWKERKVYLVNGLTFLFTFFAARICILPITFNTLSIILGTPDFGRVNLFCKFIFLGGIVIIDTLNVYWFVLISKGAYKALSKKRDA